jgi:hypothetical protein
MTKLNGHRAKPPKLSRKARAKRKPLPPEQLVGAMHDTVHRDLGKVRAAKAFKITNVQHTASTPPEVVRVLTDALNGKLPRVEGWWITCGLTGHSLPVPGVPQDRWFKARAVGVALLGEALGVAVSQDAVRLDWVKP